MAHVPHGPVGPYGPQWRMGPWPCAHGHKAPREHRPMISWAHGAHGAPCAHEPYKPMCPCAPWTPCAHGPMIVGLQPMQPSTQQMGPSDAHSRCSPRHITNKSTRSRENIMTQPYCIIVFASRFPPGFKPKRSHIRPKTTCFLCKLVSTSVNKLPKRSPKGGLGVP